MRQHASAALGTAAQVLVVATDEPVYRRLCTLLHSRGDGQCDVRWVPDAAAAVDLLATDGHDLCLLMHDAAHAKAAELLRQASLDGRRAAFIILTATEHEAAALAASHPRVTPVLAVTELRATTFERGLRTALRLRDERRALADSEARYEALFAQTPSASFELDEEGRVTRASECAARSLGMQLPEVLGRAFTELHVEDDRERVERLGARARERRGNLHSLEARLCRRDGSTLWVREVARAIGAPAGPLLVVCEDVSEARDLAERLHHQSRHDALTELVNRGEFERRLVRATRTAREQGANHAVCYLDLDQFKVVNDTCGHAAGDELLRRVARMLLDRVRARDTLARLGGDEFGLLLEHCPLEQAEQVAHDILAMLSEFRFSWDGNRFSIGASIGVVPIAGLVDANAVLEAADHACYAAKEGGRNRVHVYHDADTVVSERRSQMRSIATVVAALDEDRLELAFQPITSTGQPRPRRRGELLVRLRDSDGTQVPPGAFLPAAERYDMVGRIDRWVVAAACRWLATVVAEFEDDEFCCINLSGQSIGDPALLSVIEENLQRHAVPARAVCFEVTETAAIARLEQAIEMMHTLRARGCRFALDDFGTGLSSFAYLKSLPVDYVKIDGVFVRRIAEDATDRAIVRAINEVAHSMGKQTIAEFVESAAALENLRRIGVDYAQGYHLGRPEPVKLP